MHKVVLVGWREFREKVRSRGFFISSLAVPIMMIVIWAFTGSFGENDQGNPMEDLEPAGDQQMTIGYVDHADLIQKVPEPVPSEIFRAYEDEETARAALQRGEIEAFYVVPKDYRQSGDVQRVSQGLPAAPADTQWFNWVLITNLFPEMDTAQIRRLNWPFNSTGPQFISLETENESTGDGFTMLPFIVTIAVMLPLFTSGGYLLQSVTQEKSSRVMEILLNSLRPWHMLAGKLLGLGALTLIQYLIWGVIAFIGLQATGQGIAGLLGEISLSAVELALVVPFALGGFLLYAGLMAGIGALAPDMEGSRSWVFVISLPMMIPIYLWTAIVNSPNGVFAVALSMIPFSAPVAMLMRMTTTAVPVWQLTSSLILLVLTGIGIIWLMARLFRVQTLLSGESLSLKRFFAAIRG
jgi:ABC-2 type transport system permease protein